MKQMVCVCVCVCVSFIDHSRTCLTAGSNDDGNKALSPRKGGNYLIY
jgi:hypothetical protein